MRISDIFGMGMDPPPSNAECDSVSGDARTRAVCAELQDPIVWRSGHPPVPIPAELTRGAY